MSIKISDLVAGETVLVSKVFKYERLVTDVLQNSVGLSNQDDFVKGVTFFRIEQINTDFTILEPKKPRIPEVGNYFETMPFVKVKNNNEEEYLDARLIEVWNHVHDGLQFVAVTKLQECIICKYCEYIEENE